MDVNEMEKLLRLMVEDFDLQYEAAENQVKEHEDDWKDQFFYAECLQMPVKEQQFLFWNGNSCSEEGRVKELFEYYYKYYGHKFAYIWVVKYNRDKPKNPAAGVTYVKKNSEEYWKALAQSGYLIGEGILPAAFVKRKEQIYVNLTGQTMDTGIDGQSLLKKEYRKADILPDSKEEIGSLAERIITKKPEESAENNKQKVLFLTNWKEEREHRYYLKQLLSLTDSEKYDLTVMTPRMGNASLESEFETLPGTIEKYVYRGRMTTTRKEFLILYILEKNPFLYQREPKVHEFINGLIKREWKRIWGKADFDIIVLAGNPGASRYFLACGSGAKKMILLNLGFIEKLQQKYPSETEDICSAFDCIYTFPDVVTQIQRRYLPVIYGEKVSADEEPCITEFENKDCLICDRWICDANRTAVKLVEYPQNESCLVNAMLPPDPKREAYLKEELRNRKVYLVGKESKTYAGFLPESTVLDSYVMDYLPGLPAAGWFYERFQAYYGDDRLEYDRLEEIYRHFNRIN